jgi:hypothetical protein
MICTKGLMTATESKSRLQTQKEYTQNLKQMWIYSMDHTYNRHTHTHTHTPHTHRVDVVSAPVQIVQELTSELHWQNASSLLPKLYNKNHT